MSAYRGYLEAQRYLSSKAMDMKILARAFTRLPNLETLQVDYRNLAIGSLELIDAFGRFKAKDLVTCNCEYVLPTLFQALSSSRTKFKIFKLGPVSDDDEVSYDNGGDLSEALRADSSLVPLSHAELPSRATTSNPDSIIVDALSKTFSTSYSNTDIYWNALVKLRELRIGELCIPSSDPADLVHVSAAIRMIIKSAPEIETVVVELIDVVYGMPKPCLTATFPTYPLKRLRVFKISDFKTTVSALTTFFRHHRRSLVEVKLEGVDIEHSDWSSALLQLRTIKFCSLKLFALSGCDSSESDLEVQDYILRETDEDPLL